MPMSSHTLSGRSNVSSFGVRSEDTEIVERHSARLAENDFASFGEGGEEGRR